MKVDVTNFIRACDACNKRSDYGKSKAPLGGFQESTEFGYRISCDIVGPLPLSSSNNKYVLTVIDHFTRYAEFVALPDQTAETIATAIVHRIITKFGVPHELLTDQGTNFTSELIKNMCKLLKIKKLQTTAYHPMSNGRTERVHRTIPKMLSHYVNRNQTDWDELLPLVNMAYNTQTHESTGYTPYEMVFGRKMRTPLESDLTITEDMEIYSDYVEDLRARLQEIKGLSETCQNKARKSQKIQYDKKAVEKNYKVGQRVYLHVPQIKKGRVKKLSKLWKGPYTIVEVLSSLNVVLRIRGKNVTVHVNRIKPALEFVLAEEAQGDSPGDEVIEEDAEEHQENLEEEDGEQLQDHHISGPVEEQPEPCNSQSSQERNDPSRSDGVQSTRLRRKPARFQDYEVYRVERSKAECRGNFRQFSRTPRNYIP